MIRIHPATLNVHTAVHPMARFAVETLIWAAPDRFQEASLEGCDCVLVNAPACPPYVFDQTRADVVVRLKKPVFILNDADGAMPDCEGERPSKEFNFQNFVRGGNGIKAYFYREWHQGYERPDLPFPLLPYELAGYRWTNHPKDKKEWPVQTEAEFNARPLDMLFAQSLHVQSRKAMYEALKGRPRVWATDGYTNRYPLDILMEKQAEAKITIALEGSGIKCQSHCEAPVNSVMALPDIQMHESYPWVDGVNCIRLPYERDKGEGSLVHNYGRGVVNAHAAIINMSYFLETQFLPQPSLYSIYRLGVENAQNYSLPNYWRNYIGKEIEKRL
jgi:hypothetical protein